MKGHYLKGLKIKTALFLIDHGLKVLQTAVNAVQIVHELQPETHRPTVSGPKNSTLCWHSGACSCSTARDLRDLPQRSKQSNVTQL